MADFDWNDVRFVLAAVRDGSALTASRALKVSQPTVGRRIAALEAALGVPLFERSQAGLRLTDQAQALLPRFQAVEEAARALEAAALAEGRQVSGTLRVTTNEIIANYGLAPALREFGLRYPEIRVEVIVTDRLLDLAGGEADVAIRGGARPAEPGVVARRLGGSTIQIFGSADYYARYGRPGALQDLDNHVFVACDGPYAVAERLVQHYAPAARFEYRSSSPLNMIMNARHGLGLVILPTAYFRQDPDLSPCLEFPGLTADDWLATHESLRHAPRVRAFLDFVPTFEASRRKGEEPQTQTAGPQGGRPSVDAVSGGEA